MRAGGSSGSQSLRLRWRGGKRGVGSRRRGSIRAVVVVVVVVAGSVVVMMSVIVMSVVMLTSAVMGTAAVASSLGARSRWVRCKRVERRRGRRFGRLAGWRGGR